MSTLTIDDVEEVSLDIAALFSDLIDRAEVEKVSDQALGRILAAAVRLYAAKLQAGSTAAVFHGNSGVTATDVAIGCTAMLEAVDLELFELGLWENWSGLGKTANQDV